MSSGAAGGDLAPPLRKELDKENERPRGAVSEPTLDKRILKEAARENYRCRRETVSERLYRSSRLPIIPYPTPRPKNMEKTSAGK